MYRGCVEHTQGVAWTKEWGSGHSRLGPERRKRQNFLIPLPHIFFCCSPLVLEYWVSFRNQHHIEGMKQMAAYPEKSIGTGASSALHATLMSIHTQIMESETSNYSCISEQTLNFRVPVL